MANPSYLSKADYDLAQEILNWEISLKDKLISGFMKVEVSHLAEFQSILKVQGICGRCNFVANSGICTFHLNISQVVQLLKTDPNYLVSIELSKRLRLMQTK